MNASGKFLGQRDDDARRASQIAEPILVLVLDHFADQFFQLERDDKDSPFGLLVDVRMLFLDVIIQVSCCPLSYTHPSCRPEVCRRVRESLRPTAR